MTETPNTSIVTAINRLTRAGSESSRATAKLHEAANAVAAFIEQEVPVGVALPRGYTVCRVRSNVGSETYLTWSDARYDGDEVWIDGTGRYLHGDFNAAIPDQTRAGSLMFAKDIADGLLDEIAALLEARAVEADRAAGVLAEKADEVRA